MTVVTSRRSWEGCHPCTISWFEATSSPGFVDIHTHYDGQATWDGELEPSTPHGYRATIVAGEVTRERDTFTGARPGRLVRS